VARDYKVRQEDIRRPPTHPGELLREDVLPALGLGVSEAAARLRVTRQTLHRVISGRSAVTPEMAVRIGKLCGNGPDLWLNMQQRYELCGSRRGSFNGEKAEGILRGSGQARSRDSSRFHFDCSE